MIPLEGRVLNGLDEFMLRLGHLTIVCDVGCNVGASWNRITREASSRLTRMVSVPPELNDAVAEYIWRKRLSPAIGPDDSTRSASEGQRFRYPQLVIRQDGSGKRSIKADKAIEIWWQDVCLASPGVASRVGAITLSAKSGSKTGFSHITDWAQLAGLTSRTGEILPIGRLVAGLRLTETENPYQIGNERLPLGFALLGADLDVFVRLTSLVLEAEIPIRKQRATELFARAATQLAQEARDARNISTRSKYSVFGLHKDLETAAKRRGSTLEQTSTAWHRASSRFETYVDLGLLEKGIGGEEERFEYIYYPSQRLRRAAASFQTVTSARQWLETHLAAILLDIESDREIDEELLLRTLPRIVLAIARSGAPLPIDSLAIGLAWLLSENGKGVSIGASRAALEALAVRRPELARLSRGGFGDRAEFISLEMRRLEGTPS